MAASEGAEGLMPMPDMSNVDPGLQPTLIAFLYLFPGLALAVLLVRFWRKSVDHLLGGDDAIIGVAWLLSLGNSIITHMFVKKMFTGYRPQDVPFPAIDMVAAMKLQYALSIEYNPCICLVKASFLWSLYKLRSSNPWIKHSIVGLQILNAVYMVATTIIAAVPCLPIAKSWDSKLPGSCYSPVMYVMGNVSVVIITDFFVMLIPTWIIWDLQMPLKRKLVTISFLSLGFVVIAVGIARLIWLLGAFQGTINNYSVQTAYTAIESSVAIVGASGPTIKYLLSFCIPWLRPAFDRSTTNKSSGNRYGHGGYDNNSHGNASGARNTRNNGTNVYDDLDSINADRQDIEMKGDWRKSSDAHSDELRITGDNGVNGIIKSVAWTVDSREDSRMGQTMTAGDRTPGGRSAASPAHII